MKQRKRRENSLFIVLKETTIKYFSKAQSFSLDSVRFDTQLRIFSSFCSYSVLIYFPFHIFHCSFKYCCCFCYVLRFFFYFYFYYYYYFIPDDVTAETFPHSFHLAYFLYDVTSNMLQIEI